jgi:lysophospholipase L1-like esterase
MRLLSVAARIALVATVLVAVAAPASTAASRPRADGYVALGDSYTSAPLVPPDTSGTPTLCARSGGNYPHLLAEQLRLKLTDVSCAGATSKDVTEARSEDIPAQIAAVKPDTGLVTVGIGGNDNNLFASVVTGCGARAPLILAGSAAPCRDAFADKFADDINSDATNIREMLLQIHAAAPHARVLVVGYPMLLPRDAVGRTTCVLGGIPFSPQDMDFLDNVEQQLNRMLAEAAADTRSGFVDTYTPSRGHDMCQLPSVRWIEPLFPAAHAAPLHPNAAGQAATARAVALRLP